MTNRREPFPSWPRFDQDEIDAVTQVLRSGRVNYWTGDQGRLFEKEFAAICGARHAIALANGTVALELALRALRIGTGDEVVVSPRTFIASASAIVNAGATPIFADVDPVSQNITADGIRRAITARTRAILCVHLAGWPCDMDPILALARQHGLKVIEDCAQAHGAHYKGRPVGSLGNVAAWSFCQDKIMTTGGEGGMLTTSDPDLWKWAWAYKDHGKSWDAVHASSHPPGFRWLHGSFGTNWRMTEMQAAIGRIQLQRLPGWVGERRRNAALLNGAFRQCPALRPTEPPPEIAHAYYKAYVFVRPERLKPGWNRDRIMATLTAKGIPCFSGTCPEVYLEQAFESVGLGPAQRLPVARQLGETSLMFPVHPGLTPDDMSRIAEAVIDVMIEASIG